jgi:membrane protein
MGRELLAKFKRIQEQLAVIFQDRGVVLDERKLNHLQRIGHFWVLVGKSFMRNRCPSRASALAYTTLLGLVPLLAVVISVSASLLKEQGEEQIEDLIIVFVAKVAPQLDLIPEHEAIAIAMGEEVPEGEARQLATQGTREAAQRIQEYIRNIRSGALGVTGMLVLVFIGISLLSTVEATFNDIWGAKRSRNLFNQVVQYWAAITLGPLLFVLVIGLKGMPYLEKVPFLQRTLTYLETAPWLHALVGFALPFFILAAMFALFYLLMPNTKVYWKAALIGGLVASLLWHINSHLNAIYVAQVVRNTQIYGSLGMIPVFLIGLYLSWLILLFGGQVSYAFQNRAAYFQERQAESVNERGREFIALRMMTYIAQKFHRGEQPPSSSQIAEALAVPSRLICVVIEPLLTTRLLVEAKGVDTAYVPGRPLNQISYENILEAIRAGQGQELETRDEPSRETVRCEFKKILDAEYEVAGAVTLERLVRDAPVHEECETGRAST